MINVQTIVTLAPHVLPTGRIPLLARNKERALSGRIRRPGRVDGSLQWDGLSLEEFNALIYALFGDFVTASTERALSVLDETHHYSPFLVTLEKPQEGEHYELSSGGAHVRNLRVPYFDARLQTLTKTSNYTLVGGDLLVYGDASGGNVTLTLPIASAVNPNVVYSAEKTSAANTLSVARAGSDTINGGTTALTLTALHGRYDLVSDGASAWRTV
jgi:hypothetical protein